MRGSIGAGLALLVRVIGLPVVLLVASFFLGVALGLGRYAVVALVPGALCGLGAYAALRDIHRLASTRGKVTARLATIAFAAIAAGVVVFVSWEAHRAAAGLMSYEPAAIGSMRTLTNAQDVYRRGGAKTSGHGGYAPSLRALGDAGLIDATLASGTRQGYGFTLLHADPFTWSALASPRYYAGPPQRFFFVDESGVIRFSSAGPATASDSAIGG